MFYLILYILLNTRQLNETIQWYVEISPTSHDKVKIMLWNVMIIDENANNIRIILILSIDSQFFNHVSVLDRCVNNIDTISLHGHKYCQA